MVSDGIGITPSVELEESDGMDLVFLAAFFAWADMRETIAATPTDFLLALL